ncbi:hypothetical protein EV2_024785 [Malus domestica]
MPQAEVIFDGIILKYPFLWNFLIRGMPAIAVRSSLWFCTLKCLVLDRKRTILRTLLFSRRAAICWFLEIGRRVHGEVVVSGLESDIYVG